MNILAKKLQLNSKTDTVVLNKPDIFSAEFTEDIFSESLICTSIVENAVVFVSSKEQFINQMLTLFPRLQDYSTLWILYPKETTKKQLANLHLEFDWDFLGDYRLKPVRQINIDNNWNAIKLKKFFNH